MYDDSHHKANPKSKKKRVQKFATGGPVMSADDAKQADVGPKIDSDRDAMDIAGTKVPIYSLDEAQSILKKNKGSKK